MKRLATHILIVSTIGGLSLTAGCDLALGILLPSKVTVTLVNGSPTFDIETMILYDDDDLPELLLVQDGFGVEREDIVGAGNSMSFVLDCDEVEVILLEDADLLLIGGLGPDVDGDLLRMGDDFDCGDEIVFTFTHSAVVMDFTVDIEVR